MIISFHTKFSSDLHSILAHYEKESGKQLADEFYAELMVILTLIQENPRQFPHYRNCNRRANFSKFPYHIIYEIRLNYIWAFLLRHNRRDPKFGMRRQ